MRAEVLYPTIQDEKFNELIVAQNEQPFLVVFTADWLGEGTIMDTIVEQLADEFQNEFGFYRIDIEASKELSHQLGIRRLPTILFFHKGELMHQILGIKAKRILKEKIKEII